MMVPAALTRFIAVPWTSRIRTKSSTVMLPLLCHTRPHYRSQSNGPACTVNSEPSTTAQLIAMFDKHTTRWEQERRDLTEQFHARERNLTDQLHARDIKLEGLKYDLMKAIDAKLVIEENFNLRGALERITFQAVRVEHIIDDVKGVQARLNLLAKTKQFQALLQVEIASHKLVENDVKHSIQTLYQMVSRHAHGNDGYMKISDENFTANEVAALVVFFKLQSRWTNALTWHVDEKQPAGHVLE